MDMRLQAKDESVEQMEGHKNVQTVDEIEELEDVRNVDTKSQNHEETRLVGPHWYG